MKAKTTPRNYTNIDYDIRNNELRNAFRHLLGHVINPKSYAKLLRRPSNLLRVPGMLRRTVSPLFNVNFRTKTAREVAESTENCLKQICDLRTGGREVLMASDFPEAAKIANAVDVDRSILLKALFDQHGSDKAAFHDYHTVYQPVIDSIRSRSQSGLRLLEIGLGSNNVDTPSNMGIYGRPGASLRAFRDYLQNFQIYGADIDRRILFDEERISTQWVDQLDPNTLKELFRNLEKLDMIIDDGLHTAEANLNTFSIGKEFLNRGGWIVIEDISLGDRSVAIWKLVSLLVEEQFSCFVVQTSHAYMFLAQKK